MLPKIIKQQIPTIETLILNLNNIPIQFHLKLTYKKERKYQKYLGYIIWIAIQYYGVKLKFLYGVNNGTFILSKELHVNMLLLSI